MWTKREYRWVSNASLVFIISTLLRCSNTDEWNKLSDEVEFPAVTLINGACHSTPLRCANFTSSINCYIGQHLHVTPLLAMLDECLGLAPLVRSPASSSAFVVELPRNSGRDWPATPPHSHRLPLSADNMGVARRQVAAVKCLQHAMGGDTCSATLVMDEKGGRNRGRGGGRTGTRERKGARGTRAREGRRVGGRNTAGEGGREEHEQGRKGRRQKHGGEGRKGGTQARKGGREKQGGGGSRALGHKLSKAAGDSRGSNIHTDSLVSERGSSVG
ncbi:hypothetical protein E2C01_004467 [Portunus trituberculatus]|uniref:Uncharacterized protein n=1 Tax=Portunus trituberculatus TaxID=210409 RepID=A0A5B7CQ22_PORTR|nr:hypothetical protein [Portunus trituberculatus]